MNPLRTVCLLLSFFLGFSPLAAGLAAAAEAPRAPKDATSSEAALLNRLAKNGFLGDKKALYLKASSFTGDQVVDALVEIDKNLPSLQGNGTQAGASYTQEDLQGLLDMERARKDALWDRKVKVWSFENNIKAMQESWGKLSASSGKEEDRPKEEKLPAPTMTPTPAPEVTQADLDKVASQVKDLAKGLETLSSQTDKQLDQVSKDAAEAQRSANENMDQLKILKKLVDQVQDNLTKTGEKLEAVSQKASKKALTDEQLRQELTILHKDLRDNSQDVSVLKQEMARLEQKKSPQGQSPLDEALTSPWLAGGALVVGLAALIVSVTK